MAVNVQAKLNMPKFGTKQVAKPARQAKQAVQKAVPKPATIKKAVPAPVRRAAKSVQKAASAANPLGARAGGVGYRKYDGDDLWLPNTTRPEWLDGSLPGDRGFDPLGLAKPAEYLQVDVDELDQNKAINKPGNIVGNFEARKEMVSSAQALQPYDEVFGLERFRECELIHGRWAMLACLGCVVAEATTGVSWVEAGKVELDGARYFNLDLPFTITQLVWIEVILVGGAEIYRNRETDTERRIYPGGYFDPFKLASSGDERQTRRLKESEIRHARLAMIAFLGYSVQALVFGEGALGSLALFTKNFS